MGPEAVQERYQTSWAVRLRTEVPDPMKISFADAKDKERAKAIAKVIRAHLAKCQQERPCDYSVREAPADDVKNLQQLAGHLTDNWFITKFRKIFARDEMNDDLAMVPARYTGAEATPEYEELLPVQPP